MFFFFFRWNLCSTQFYPPSNKLAPHDKEKNLRTLPICSQPNFGQIFIERLASTLRGTSLDEVWEEKTLWRMLIFSLTLEEHSVIEYPLHQALASCPGVASTQSWERGNLLHRYFWQTFLLVHISEASNRTFVPKIFRSMNHNVRKKAQWGSENVLAGK